MSTSDPAQILHLVRLTMEAKTPISLGSGEIDADSDVLLCRDASGLPTIPGSSLQGSLRSMWETVHGADLIEVFGCLETSGQDGIAGRLLCGFGLTHDRHNRAVTTLLTSEELGSDPVLDLLVDKSPILRDHVRLNDRHTVDERGKFDRSAVPVGTRFSSELAMWGFAEECDSDFRLLCSILHMLNHPAFRLGGAGRRGYGSICVRSASWQVITSLEPDGVRAVRSQPPSVPLETDITKLGGWHEPFSGVVEAVLRLRPLGPWRIGGDTPSDPEKKRASGHSAGMRSPSLTADTYGIRMLESGPDDVSFAWDEPSAISKPSRRADAQKREFDENADDQTLRLVQEPRIVWDGDRLVDVEIPGRSASVLLATPGSSIRGSIAHRALFYWNVANGCFVDPADTSLSEEQNLEKLAQYSKRPDPLAAFLGSAKERSPDKGRASSLYVSDGQVSGVAAVQAVAHNSIDRFSGGTIAHLLFTEEVAIGGVIKVQLVIMPPAEGREWQKDLRAHILSALQDLVTGKLAIGGRSHGFCDGEVEWLPPGSAWEQDWKILQHTSNKQKFGDVA